MVMSSASFHTILQWKANIHLLGFNHSVVQFSSAKIYIQNTIYIFFKPYFVFCLLLVTTKSPGWN